MYDHIYIDDIAGRMVENDGEQDKNLLATTEYESTNDQYMKKKTKSPSAEPPINANRGSGDGGAGGITIAMGLPDILGQYFAHYLNNMQHFTIFHTNTEYPVIHHPPHGSTK